MGHGLVGPPGAGQQVGPRRRQQRVGREARRERVEQRQAGVGPVAHPHRDRPVQLDDRRRVTHEELVVQGDDAVPPRGGGRLRGGVDLGDRGLQHVGAATAGRPQLLAGPGDLAPPPQPPVLLLDRQQLAARPDPGVPPRVLQHQQGQQPARLGLAGHELDELAGQVDRGRRQSSVGGRRVALVERQVDHRGHAGQPRLEPLGRGDLVRDARVGDLAPRPHEALRHRRRRHEEGAGDVGDLEPRHRAQRERDLRVEGERGVTAREDQAQPLVAGRDRLAARGRHRQLGPLVVGPAQEVDRPVPRGHGQPGRRVGRRPVRLPADERGGERVAGGVLGERPVARQPDQARHDAGPVRPVGAGDRLGRRRHPPSFSTGRISMRPWCAIGCRVTKSIAWSRSSHSSRS